MELKAYKHTEIFDWFGNVFPKAFQVVEIFVVAKHNILMNFGLKRFLQNSHTKSLSKITPKYSNICYIFYQCITYGCL